MKQPLMCFLKVTSTRCNVERNWCIFTLVDCIKTNTCEKFVFVFLASLVQLTASTKFKTKVPNRYANIMAVI